MGNKIYGFLMAVGGISGCHQIPDRSFTYHGKQFPVCARCTGAFVGYFVGAVLFYFVKVPFTVSISLCAVMFFDWFIQYMEIKKSTNLRRFITGTLCGFGLVQLYFSMIAFFIKLICLL